MSDIQVSGQTALRGTSPDYSAFLSQTVPQDQSLPTSPIAQTPLLQAVPSSSWKRSSDFDFEIDAFFADDFSSFRELANSTDTGDDNSVLWAVLGLSLLALFLLLSALMFYSNVVLEKNKSSNLQKDFIARAPSKANNSSISSLSNQNNSNNNVPNVTQLTSGRPNHGVISQRNARMSKASEKFRTSMSSLFSRDRLSTWSGRYSGKIEAIPGKDDHLANFMREARHEDNVVKSSDETSFTPNKVNLSKTKNSMKEQSTSLYHVPNARKKTNKVSEVNWENSSLQEVQTVGTQESHVDNESEV